MTQPYYSDDHVSLYHGDCLEVLATLPDASVDSVVTDPPYGLEFMGKGWDAPWEERDVNADAGFHGGGVSATRNAPSFTGSTNPKCLTCKGTRRGRRDGTAKVAVCLCPDGGRFPNVRAVEMRAFQDWCEQWATECLRVLKPGGHMLAFGGSRTWHRLAAAVEDAGFEIRDSIAWLYGSGFSKGGLLGNKAGLEWCECGPSALPEPLDDGARRGRVGCPRCGGLDPAFRGFSTTLKPAFEPIVVARKPLTGTVAQTVLQHGTGALNIDGCRVAHDAESAAWVDKWSGHEGHPGGMFGAIGRQFGGSPSGRWPTNVLLDDSQAAALDKQSGERTSGVLAAHHTRNPKESGILGAYGSAEGERGYGDTGGASRFFPTFRYEAKAPTSERPRVDGIAHPTVKPLDLMRWLVRLVTPPDGTVLEPFAGSGTTAEACVLEGFQCIAIEREPDYLPLIVSRLSKPMQLGLDFGATA